MSFWERLDKYVRGGPSAVEKPFELLRQQEFDQQVTGALTDRLSERSFSVPAKRRWVRPNGPGILAMVELQTLKSESTAAWGVSLDFVPHVTTKREIAWHRTHKNARFDLSYHPFDYEADPRPWKLSRFETREELPKESLLFASRVVESAVRYLDPMTNPRAVLEALEEKRRRPYIRLGFEHYPQEMLAYAFVLARCGDHGGARDALKSFAQQHQIPKETEESLMALLQPRS